VEIFEKLTTYQKKNAKLEEDINKIKNEIKEVEIKPSLDANKHPVENVEEGHAQEDVDKSNHMTFVYNDLKNWVSVTLNKLLTCQVRDVSSAKESNSYSLSESFSMLAKHMDEICNELEKMEEEELREQVR